VVLQDEVIGVDPVVGDVTRVVVAHHVGRRAVATGRVGRVQAAPPARRRPCDKPAHRPAGDVGAGVGAEVRAAAIAIVAVVVGFDALLILGGGIADDGRAVRHGDAVGAGVGPEVAVERAVLLHDHDDVLDLVDALIDGAVRVGLLALRARGSIPRSRHGGRRSDECPRGEEEEERQSGQSGHGRARPRVAAAGCPRPPRSPHHCRPRRPDLSRRAPSPFFRRPNVVAVVSHALYSGMAPSPFIALPDTRGILSVPLS